jgi:hypothetical protein
LSWIEVGREYPSLETLENIAKVLNFEMEDLLEFHHKDSVDSVADEISSIMKSASDRDLQVFLKLLKALIR